MQACWFSMYDFFEWRRESTSGAGLLGDNMASGMVLWRLS